VPAARFKPEFSPPGAAAPREPEVH
jgi:hypothetical protein